MVVGAADPFVIALDASQLGIFGFHGISTLPAVVEAVYPLGAMQVHFPLGAASRQPTVDIQHRVAVVNANAAEVATTRFLDPAYEGISGILCSDRSDAVRMPAPPMSSCTIRWPSIRCYLRPYGSMRSIGGKKKAAVIGSSRSESHGVKDRSQFAQDLCQLGMKNGR